MERQRLLAFIRVVAQFISDRSCDAGFPFADIRWEGASLAGLRMAAGDFVEWWVDVSGEQLIVLDTVLASAGAPTLTAMRLAEYRTALAVLGRGGIRTEREWRLLNGLLSDTAGRTLTTAEREHAERLVHEYESRA